MKKIGEFYPNSKTNLGTLIILFMLMLLYDKFISDLSFSKFLSGFDIYTLIALVFGITFFIQHEILHILPSFLLGYGHKSSLKLTSVNIDGYIKKSHILIIILTPVALITLTYLTLAVMFEQFATVFILAVVINFIGSKNDMSQAFQIFKYKGKDIFVKGDDNEDSKLLHVYQKDNSVKI